MARQFSTPKAVGARPARGAQHGATIAMKENLPHDFFQETGNIFRHVDADLTGGAKFFACKCKSQPVTSCNNICFQRTDNELCG
jgi:hypothetical protein